MSSGVPSEILGAEDLNRTTNANNSAEEITEHSTEEVAANIEPCKGSSSLMQEEEKDIGVVKLHVYKSYWIAVGTILAPLVLISLLLMQGKYATGFFHVFSKADMDTPNLPTSSSTRVRN